MSLYLDDGDFQLYVGDVRDELALLEPGSVDCVVTSPPYWGLRDYGTGEWDGGNPDCDHSRHVDYGEKSDTNRGSIRGGPMGQTCEKCGAARVDQQIGLEPTPEAYVAEIVNVFRGVRRVLADHGTVWLNLGDSYASSPPGNVAGVGATSGLHGVNDASGVYRETLKAGHATKRSTVVGDLKPKDLVGIPWRVAFALQADGWYLRSDIIWAKPNPMPESVTDRPTKAHEYVFLLSKRPRYFFDQEAVREGYTPDERVKRVHDHAVNGSHENHAAMTDGRERWAHTGRNVRSVWEIATQPYAEAHFATYPEELVRRCLLAGCPPRGTVLDPFCGSGTTALVARKHGRRCVGIELSPVYAELCARRLSQLSLLAEGTA